MMKKYYLKQRDMVRDLARVKGVTRNTALLYVQRLPQSWRDTLVTREIFVKDDEGAIIAIGECQLIKTPIEVIVYSKMRKAKGGRFPKQANE